jgi:hypothetical protein
VISLASHYDARFKQGSESGTVIVQLDGTRLLLSTVKFREFGRFVAAPP